MPSAKPIVAALCAVAAAGAALGGCGSGDDQPDPSISPESAQTLLGSLQEIESNIAVGSCFVAADKVEELRAEIDELPSDVNEDVASALAEGTDRLASLVPAECEGAETTTEETTTTEQTTTEETTTEQTRPTTTTTPPTTTTTPPTTTTAPPPSGGGGVSPGGGDGL